MRETIDCVLWSLIYGKQFGWRQQQLKLRVLPAPDSACAILWCYTLRLKSAYCDEQPHFHHGVTMWLKFGLQYSLGNFNILLSLLIRQSLSRLRVNHVVMIWWQFTRSFLEGKRVLISNGNHTNLEIHTRNR